MQAVAARGALYWMRHHQLAKWALEWRWVLALSTFLLLPILTYEMRWSSGGPDRSILFIFPISLLWVVLVQLLARRVWLTHALLFPLYVVVGADLFVIHFYQTRLSSSMLLLMLDNINDSAEFLRTNALRIASPLALFVGLFGYALWRVRTLRVTLSRKFALLPLGGLFALYVVCRVQVGDLLHLAAADRSSPFGVFPQVLISYRVYADALQMAAQAKSFRFGATRLSPPVEPELYVLVIGESARPDHFSLNGYFRNTNPRLSQLENVIAFRDVVSQSALTKEAVPLLLTRGTIADRSRAARERSVISIFHEAGFQTAWLATQSKDPFTGNINRYSGEADTQRYFDRRHDGVLVDSLRILLSRRTPASDKLFVVLHTQGSHFWYKNRYPEEFAVFPDSAQGLTEHEKLINSYDNAILYTDYVLSEVISVLRSRPGIKALFYWGDHGENLEDDERKLYGHVLFNEYDLPIPMLFWYSPEYGSKHPDLIGNARRNTLSPFSSRSALHSLVQMAAITIHDPDTDRLSVFRADPTPVPRMVAGTTGVRDFDRWLDQTGLKGSGVRRDRSVVSRSTLEH